MMLISILWFWILVCVQCLGLIEIDIVGFVCQLIYLRSLHFSAHPAMEWLGDNWDLDVSALNPFHRWLNFLVLEPRVWGWPLHTYHLFSLNVLVYNGCRIGRQALGYFLIRCSVQRWWSRDAFILLVLMRLLKRIPISASFCQPWILVLPQLTSLQVFVARVLELRPSQSRVIALRNQILDCLEVDLHHLS